MYILDIYVYFRYMYIFKLKNTIFDYNIYINI